MNIKKYLEEKKYSISKNAKKAIATGLTVATILTGTSALTSCDGDDVDFTNSVEVMEAIVDNLRERKEGFELDCIKFISWGEGEDRYCRMDCQDIDENRESIIEGSQRLKARLSGQISEEFFEKIKDQVKDQVEIINGEGCIWFEISKDNLVDESNLELSNMIYNEIQTNSNLEFWDYETELAD